MKIVIIEDSPLVRKCVRELLCEEHDLQLVGEAGNITDGLRIVKETDPDILILDIVMPGGSGLTLLRSVKSMPQKRKVIMLSNHAEDQIRVEAKLLGADRFLDKAFEFEQLIDAIRK